MVSRLTERIEEVSEKPQSGPDQNQWMKADETNAEELEDRHTRPSVIVCIRDHKPRKREKEINGEVSVMHQSEWAPEPKRVIKNVEDHDQKCSTASQPIQHFKVLLSATGVIDNDGNIHQLDLSIVEAQRCTPARLVGIQIQRDSFIAQTQRTTRVPVKGVLSDDPPTRT